MSAGRFSAFQPECWLVILPYLLWFYPFGLRDATGRAVTVPALQKGGTPAREAAGPPVKHPESINSSCIVHKYFSAMHPCSSSSSNTQSAQKPSCRPYRQQENQKRGKGITPFSIFSIAPLPPKRQFRLPHSEPIWSTETSPFTHPWVIYHIEILGPSLRSSQSGNSDCSTPNKYGVQ